MNRETLAFRRKILDQNNQDYVASMNNLAITLLYLNKLDEAFKFSRDTLDLWKRVHKPYNQNEQSCFNTI